MSEETELKAEFHYYTKTRTPGMYKWDLMIVGTQPINHLFCGFATKANNYPVFKTSCQMKGRTDDCRTLDDALRSIYDSMNAVLLSLDALPLMPFEDIEIITKD